MVELLPGFEPNGRFKPGGWPRYMLGCHPALRYSLTVQPSRLPETVDCPKNRTTTFGDRASGALPWRNRFIQPPCAQGDVCTLHLSLDDTMQATAFHQIHDALAPEARRLLVTHLHMGERAAKQTVRGVLEAFMTGFKKTLEHPEENSDLIHELYRFLTGSGEGDDPAATEMTMGHTIALFERICGKNLSTLARQLADECGTDGETLQAAVLLIAPRIYTHFQQRIRRKGFTEALRPVLGTHTPEKLQRVIATARRSRDAASG